MVEPSAKIDLFGPLPEGVALAISVNGNLKKTGDAVMGRGVARLAAKKYPELIRRWGRALQRQGRPIVGQSESARGNHVDILWDAPPIFAFPTKWNFWEKSDIQLIERSARELVAMMDRLRIPRVYLPRVGAGNGGLDWHREVRPVLNRYFDDRFCVVYWGDENAP